MHEIDFDLALAAIDHRRWHAAASKVRLLLMVRIAAGLHPGPGGYAQLPRRWLAKGTGMEPRWVRVVLDELVAERVLDRDPGAGRRGHAYRVAEPITRWRVPWAVVPELVEHRARTLREQHRRPEPPVVARYHAPFFDVAARDHAPQPRGNGAPWRATTRAGMARHGAPQPRAWPDGPPISTEVLCSSVDTDRVTAVIGAVEERCRGPLFGRPARHLADAVRPLSPDQAEELVRRIRAYDGPPSPPIVAEWAARAASRIAALPTPAAAPAAAWVEAPPDAAERAARAAAAARVRSLAARLRTTMPAPEPNRARECAEEVDDETEPSP